MVTGCAVAPDAQKETHVATLDKVAVGITVVLGTTSMPIHQVLRVGRGAIIELDASEEDGRERQSYRRQCRRIASTAT
jgi:flagellar motor switch/type III secretory pathway protein FliN